MAKKMPLGVKLVSIWFYIIAVLLVIGAVLAFTGSNFIPQNLPGILGAVAIALGAFLLVFAVLYFFIARGLWKGRNWARIVAIILAVIGVFNGFFAVFSGNFVSLIPLAINAAIGYYLGLSKEGKAAFK
ncbi:MAG: hypothetical protein HYS32_00320 [Candidatus Woesearchaeota archaeon]|nr:MAG: hypothetical protein HYS32_00320 [Candidatus Woesearchaeota archaeon]